MGFKPHITIYRYGYQTRIFIYLLPNVFYIWNSIFPGNSGLACLASFGHILDHQGNRKIINKKMPENNNENITIQPKGTLIRRAVFLDRFFSNPLFKLFTLLIWISGALSIAALIKFGSSSITLPDTFDATLGQTESRLGQESYLGLSYLALGIFLIFQPLRIFYREKVKYPKIETPESIHSKLLDGKPVNLFSIFSFQLAKVTTAVFNSANMVTSKEVTEALLKSPDLNFILARLGIAKNIIQEGMKNYTSEVPAINLVRDALEVAVAEEHHQIEVGDLFVAVCKHDPLFKQIADDLKLDAADIANVVHWQTSLIRRSLEGKKFLDIDWFNFTGGIGKDWAFGYAHVIQRFGHDFTEEIQSGGLGIKVVGREKEIKQIEEVLLRQNGGNVILVGEAGVGKRTTVLGLAKKIAEGALDSRVAFKHLVEIDLGAVLATGDPSALNILFNEVVSAGNIILYIENIEKLLSGDGVGSVNALNLIIPFLESPAMHVIATCDTASYNAFIRPQAKLNERLTRVSIEEPDKVSTIRILEEAVPVMEARTGSIISYEAIKAAAESADKFIADVPNPEKSIDLLDGAAAHATSGRGKTIIVPKDISEYLTLRYNVPAGDAEEGEREKLLNLEEVMHESVIGQDEAIKAIANAMRRARAGVEDTKKPIGSFLFLGPTGVGKTETAKALARAYFGNPENMIRFDMSEYQNKEDIYRFLGANLGGAEEQGALATAVREHPFALLLFDEIEKAHPDILDLFLQILDEGHLTDGSGRKVIFSHTIIICTSNAGANLIRESIQSGTDYEMVKTALLDYLQSESIYRPEFLNRFTQVVAFSPLSEDQIGEVAALMINHLKDTVQKNRGIAVDISQDAVAKLSEMGFNPQMGARPMARIIQEKVENILAEKILSGELQKGDMYTVTANDVS